ncbi:MAG: signal peptidase I [Bacteroidota bacterium]|nr:signal peptidase I [Bacteroidota bacterium]
MKQALKAFIALGIALLIMLVIRAFAFTVYTVPSDINGMLRQGDRVMVNRLSRTEFKVGDLVVYQKNADFIGKIEGLPGDTVKLGSSRYVIPKGSCEPCTTPDSRMYMVNIGNTYALMCGYQVIGKAYRLFHLPF